MITPQIAFLQNLKDSNIVCCSPPADNNSAYAIAMARREDGRARQKNYTTCHHVYHKMLHHPLVALSFYQTTSKEMLRQETHLASYNIDYMVVPGILLLL